MHAVTFFFWGTERHEASQVTWRLLRCRDTLNHCNSKTRHARCHSSFSILAHSMHLQQLLVLLSMPACLDTLATWELSERLSHVHLVRKQNPRDAPTWTSRHRRGTRLHHALPWAVRPCPSPHSHWPSQRWSIAARPVVLVSFPTWTTSSRFLPLPPPPRCSHLNCNCSSKLHRSAQPPPFFSCLPPL